DPADDGRDDICIADSDSVVIARQTDDIVADINIVISRREVAASFKAQGRVVVARGAAEGAVTHSRIEGAISIRDKSINTYGCVVAAVVVPKERERSNGCVVEARGVG